MLGVGLAGFVALGGCAVSPPQHLDDACLIFAEKRGWGRDAQAAHVRWGVPVGLQLAIIHQESRFESRAKPSRRRIFFVLPWFRRSTAFGYGQVIESTWDAYRKNTGRRRADRDDFGDVVDFIGWYADVGEISYGIDRKNPYAVYLSYHEGHGGYARGTHSNKRWLRKVARKVEARAASYEAQLARCRRR